MKDKDPESSVLERMKAEGFEAYRWENRPKAVYPVHDHTYYKLIYCVEGDIEFTFPAGKRSVHMKTGDKLEIPPHTAHSAVVGLDGVVCVEGHK